MKPRILFNAKDHPALRSGYGILSKYLLPLLGDHYGKDNVIIYAPIYQKDAIGEWEGMRVVAGNEFNYGEGLILEHYQYYDCNLLIQVGDTWPLGILSDLAAQDKVLWIQWIAVDWLGMPKNIINRIKPAYKLVPFSKYGENSLRQANLPNVDKAIWLGINTDIWKPIERDTMTNVMRSLGYDYNTFNLLIVAANQERKGIRQALEAIHIFRKVNPDAKVRLYLHSPVTGERDLRADADELELTDVITFPESYTMTQGGFSESQMAQVFNCADLLLNVCMEGYGYAQAQAQACGVPIVCLSEGAGPELTIFGWEVSPLGVVTSSHQMTQPLPNPAGTARCIEEAYKMRMGKGSPLRSENAVRFVKNNLTWDKIALQWFDVIDRCMEDRIKHCMQVPDVADWLKEKGKKEVMVS